MAKILGLKIDVDTYVGMKRGVPRLLDILDGAGIKGSFFLSMGPDASGRAILQLLKNPRFLKKMIRSNAPGLYGIRTALYGTVLPSPMIALSFPDLVGRIMAAGHEVQFHAWDHRRWQDDLGRHSVEWIRKWFASGFAAFEKLTGRQPEAFGAPAWMIDDRVLNVIRDYPLEYLSCTRAQAPFIHEGTGLPEIPSNLPCFEETGVEAGLTVIRSRLDEGGLHVLPVHAEVEGGIWAGRFVELLDIAAQMGYTIATLSRIRQMLPKDGMEVRKYRMALLPGRAVPCAV
jgi:undecaprenyl phosphate-alpha-L-ara4FN deformylase